MQYGQLVRRFFLVFLVLFLPLPFSYAATLYVNNTDQPACVGGDNYSTIQNAINAASNGDTIIVCPGNYSYTSGIVVNRSLNIAGWNGPSGVFVNFSGGASSFNLTKEWINISNLTVNSSGYYGFYLLSANYSNISGDVVETGGSAGYAVVLSSSSNNILSNNTINTSGANAYAIYITSGSGNTIADSVIATSDPDGYSAAHTVYLSSSSSNIVSNNAFYSRGIGIYFSSASTNTISNNNINSRATGLYFVSSSNSNNLSNNSVSISSSYAFANYLLYSAGSSNNFFDNATLSGSSHVYLKSSSNNNTFTNITVLNSYRGFTIESSNNNTFINNTANNNTQYGFYLSSATNSTFINNTASNNSVYGFFVSTSTGNVIVNNTIQESGAHDLFISDRSDYVSVAADTSCNNVIENNTGSGNRPINYTNATVTWSNFVSSELILCNADSSSIDNATIDGSDSLHNNAAFFIRTNNTNVSNSNSSNNYYGFYFMGNADSVISNNTVVGYRNGTGGSMSGAFAFYLLSSSRASVLNNTITTYGIGTTASHSAAYGIFIDTTSNSNFTNNTVVTSGTFSDAIRLSAATYNNFTNNTAITYGTGADGFDLESSSDYNSISEGTVSAKGIGFLIDSDYNNVSNIANVIANSTAGAYISKGYNILSNLSFNISKGSVNGVYLFGSSSTYNVISDVIIATTGGTSYGVQIDTATYNNLSGVTIDTAGSLSVGVSSSGGDYNQFSNVTINTTGACSGSCPYGIYFYQSDYNNLSNVSVSTYGSVGSGVATCGVYLDTSTNNKFLGGAITTYNVSSAEHGVIIRDSGSNTLSLLNITTYGLSANAIDVTGTNANSTLNNFSDNNILTYGSSASGVYLSGGRANLTTVANNNITTLNSSAHGLFFSSSHFNNVSGNNITVVAPSAYGAYLSNSNSSRIINNIVASNLSGIYILSSSLAIVANNTARDNLFYGIHLDSSSSNNVSSNTIFNNSQAGIYVNGSSSNNRIYSNTVYNHTSGLGSGIFLQLINAINHIYDNPLIENNTYGIYLNYTNSTNISNNTVLNNVYHGFNLAFSFVNNITNNTANNNLFVGFSLLSSSGNNLTNNSVNNNGEEGFYLSSSSNNTMANNIVNNNSYNGFDLLSSSSNNLSSNTIYNNLMPGIYIRGSSANNLIFSNTIYNNSESGIYLTGSSSANYIFSNIIYNHTSGVGAGIFLQGINGANSIYNNVQIYNNTYGIYLNYTNNTNLSGNTVYNNSFYGIYLSYSYANSIIGSSSYNNSKHGLFFEASNLTNVSNSAFAGNSQYGLYIYDSSNVNASNVHLYNNSVSDLLINATSTLSFNLTNITFDNPVGNFENYTSLTVNDSVSADSAYIVRWTTNSSATPTGRPSFRQKLVNISTITGTVSIDSISWHWDESELAGYNESNFELWKYDGSTWSKISSAVLDTENNTLTVSGLAPASDYGIFETERTPPEVAIQYPTEGLNLSNNVSIELNFTVSDIGSGINTSSCTYSLDGEPVVAISGCANTTFNVSANVEGRHNISVSVLDLVGNQGNSTVINFTIDKTAPTVAIQYPTNGLNLSTNVSIQLNFTAIDSTSGLNLSSCTYILDEGLAVEIASCTNATFNVSTNVEGNHNISVSAKDMSGNQGNSTLINFTIDKTAPTVSIGHPTEGLNLSTNESIQLNFTATDATSGLNLSSCTYSLDGGSAQTIASCANTTFNVSTNVEGNHNISVSAKDMSGNQGNSTLINFTIDKTAPTVAIQYPTNGLNLSTNVSIQLNFTAIDSLTGINTSSCTYSLDGGSAVEIASCANATFNVSANVEGNHNISVSAKDMSGNQGNSTLINFTIDKTAPSISIQSPANNTYNSSAIQLNFTVLDTVSGVSSCWYSLNNGVTNTSLASCTNTTLSSLSEGSHTVIVYANDSSSNVNSSNVSFTVDTLQSSISLNYPPNGANLTNTAINFNWTAIDAIDTSLLCNLTINDVVNASNVTSLNNTPTNYSVSGFSEAHYYWNVTCWDDANNTNTSETRLFTIDRTAPTVSLDYPTEALNLSTNESIELNFTATDATSGLNTSSCTYSLDGGSAQAISNCVNTTFNVSTNVEGNHNISVSAKDMSGNQGNSTVINFTIDLTVPQVNLQLPISGTNTSNTTPAFVFNYTDAASGTASCTLYIYNNTATAFQAFGTNLTTLNNTPTTITANHSIDESLTSWHVNCTDWVGRVGQSETRSIRIDITLPTIQLIKPANITYGGSSVTLNYTTSDSASGISACWYSLDGGSNTSLTGCANTTLDSLSNGGHTIVVYSNDTASNINSDQVSFSINTDAPAVAIQSPLNSTYNVSSVSLDFTAVDEAPGIVDSCWYSLDGGSDVPLAGCANITLDSLLDGGHTLTVYANDSGNNTGADLVSFLVDTSPPNVDIVSPTQQLSFEVGQSVEVLVNVTDNYTTVANVSGNVTKNGEYYSTYESSYNPITELYWFSFSPSSDGAYNFGIIAVDGVGNTDNSKAVSLVFTIRVGCTGTECDPNKKYIDWTENVLCPQNWIEIKAPEGTSVLIFHKPTLQTLQFAIPSSGSSSFASLGEGRYEITLSKSGSLTTSGDFVYSNCPPAQNETSALGNLSVSWELVCPTNKLSLVVSDRNNENPISGAQVGSYGKTNSNGQIVFAVTYAGLYSIPISADSYNPYSAEVYISELCQPAENVSQNITANITQNITVPVEPPITPPPTEGGGAKNQTLQNVTELYSVLQQFVPPPLIALLEIVKPEKLNKVLIDSVFDTEEKRNAASFIIIIIVLILLYLYWRFRRRNNEQKIETKQEMETKPNQ